MEAPLTFEMELPLLAFEFIQHALETAVPGFPADIVNLISNYTTDDRPSCDMWRQVLCRLLLGCGDSPKSTVAPPTLCHAMDGFAKRVNGWDHTLVVSGMGAFVSVVSDPVYDNCLLEHLFVKDIQPQLTEVWWNSLFDTVTQDYPGLSTLSLHFQCCRLQHIQNQADVMTDRMLWFAQKILKQSAIRLLVIFYDVPITRPITTNELYRDYSLPGDENSFFLVTTSTIPRGRPRVKLHVSDAQDSVLCVMDYGSGQRKLTRCSQANERVLVRATSIMA